MCYSKSSNQLLHGFQEGQTGLHCAHLSEEHLSSWLIKLEITVRTVQKKMFYDEQDLVNRNALSCQDRLYFISENQVTV